MPARCVFLLDAIVGRWRRTSCAAIRAKYGKACEVMIQIRVRSCWRHGLESLIVATHAIERSTVAFTNARSVVILKSRNLDIVLTHRTSSHTVRVAKHPSLTSHPHHETLVRIRFPAVSSLATSHWPADIRARGSVILETARPAACRSKSAVGVAGLHLCRSAIKVTRSRRSADGCVELISTAGDMPARSAAVLAREEPLSAKQAARSSVR